MAGMRSGVVVVRGDAGEVAEAARRAEDAGWDAIFVWEPVWGVDAWVALTAAAATTRRLRLGTLLTPLPRVRPWDLASKVATLDRFSGGRVQLAVGLGALHPGWTAFERPTSRRERAELLDEGLAVYDGLMRGQPFSYNGRHYVVEPTDFMLPPPPVQRPRPPVWVVGALARGRERQPSLERAARWDGLLPSVVAGEGGQGLEQPEDLAEVLDVVRPLREAAGLPWEGYDVVVEGSPAVRDRAAEWRDAGGTWWVEADWDDDTQERLHALIAAGPPLGPAATAGGDG